MTAYPVDACYYELKGGSVTARVAEYGCEESGAVAVLDNRAAAAAVEQRRHSRAASGVSGHLRQSI